jgi:hypothetical protein
VLQAATGKQIAKRNKANRYLFTGYLLLKYLALSAVSRCYLRRWGKTHKGSEEELPFSCRWLDRPQRQQLLKHLQKVRYSCIWILAWYLPSFLARIFHELLSRGREDGLATWQPQGVGSEAYLNGTSQGPTPEDARKDDHIRDRSRPFMKYPG